MNTKKEIITNKETKEGFRDNWGGGGGVGISDAGGSRRKKKGEKKRDTIEG